MNNNYIKMQLIFLIFLLFLQPALAQGRPSSGQLLPTIVYIVIIVGAASIVFLFVILGFWLAQKLCQVQHRIYDSNVERRKGDGETNQNNIHNGDISKIPV
jgi:hypothetical protein